MEITQDERRLISFFRCLSITRQDHVLQDVAEKAVKSRLPPDFGTNNFAESMPKPPEGYVSGDVHDGISSDHWLYQAIEATGDPKSVLLGSSYWDRETYFPPIREVLRSESDRQGQLCPETTDDALDNLLNEWRFNIVRACMNSISGEDT